MQFVFQKPDMDTVLTAIILGYKHTDTLVPVQGDAGPELLQDRAVICIECGGSGEVEFGNFDHHNTPLHLPPACVQAARLRGVSDSLLQALVEYVAEIDAGSMSTERLSNGLSLSNIFSGMRLLYPDVTEQFKRGVEIFNTVLEQRIDPSGPMPILEEWQGFFLAKDRQREELSCLRQEVFLFKTKSGLQGGCLQSDLPGLHGLMRDLGCEITIARGLSMPGSDLVYCTVAGKSIPVSQLLDTLKRYESGWGGPAHGNIIASPFPGTKISESTLIQIVAEGM